MPVLWLAIAASILLLASSESPSLVLAQKLAESAAAGNLEEVHQLIKTCYSSPFPIRLGLDAAYESSNLVLIQTLLNKMSVFSDGASDVHGFFYSLCSSESLDNSDPKFRESVIDALIPKTVEFSLKYISTALADIGDFHTMDKLRAALGNGVKLQLEDLQHVVASGNYDEISTIVQKADDFAIEDALDTAFRQGQLKPIKAIFKDIGSLTKNRYNAHAFLSRILNTRGDEQFDEKRGSAFEKGVKLYLLRLCGEVIRRNVFNKAMVDFTRYPLEVFTPVEHSKAGVLLSDNSRKNPDCVFTGPDNDYEIDGRGSWNPIVACLGHSSILKSAKLTIHNTGPVVPEAPMFAEAGLATKELVLRDIPDFSYIPEDFFVGFSSLTSLSLSNLGIVSLPRSVCYPLRNLETLYESSVVND